MRQRCTFFTSFMFIQTKFISKKSFLSHSQVYDYRLFLIFFAYDIHKNNKNKILEEDIK